MPNSYSSSVHGKSSRLEFEKPGFESQLDLNVFFFFKFPCTFHASDRPTFSFNSVVFFLIVEYMYVKSQIFL